MSYYTGQGDYYSGKGDPGLFSSLAGVVKGALTIGSKILPGPAGALAGFGAGLLGGRAPTVAAQIPALAMPPQPGMLERGKMAVQTFLPGGVEPFMNGATCGQGSPGYHVNKVMKRYQTAVAQGRDVQDPTSRPRVVNQCVRNRSMNPTNPKALRRAIRRQGAFVALAKRALKGSGYTFKRTGAPTRSRARKRKR